MNKPDCTPPVAAVRPRTVTSPHGSRTDPYYWLRDDERANPDVLAYLNAENTYLEKCRIAINPFENFRNILHDDGLAMTNFVVSIETVRQARTDGRRDGMTAVGG